VVALREVRRLELERQRREEETKQRELAREQEERARTEAAQRASIQYGPGLAPYVNGQGWGAPEGNGESYANPVRRTTEVVPLAAQVYESQSMPAPPPGWLEEGMAFRQAPRGKSRFGAVLVTMLICGGAGAAGYWKLGGEWKAAVARLETENTQLEEQRNEAVAARSKAEQELKVRIAELQTKLTDLASKRSAAETEMAAESNRIANRGDQSLGITSTAGSPLPGNRMNRAAWRRNKGRNFMGKPAMGGIKPINPTVKLGPGPQDEGGPGRPTPKVAKKKNLSDDPLGGLRL
jgi:hypothetical protein